MILQRAQFDGSKAILLGQTQCLLKRGVRAAKGGKPDYRRHICFIQFENQISYQFGKFQRTPRVPYLEFSVLPAP